MPDTALDWLVHNAHYIRLHGKSPRKTVARAAIALPDPQNLKDQIDQQMKATRYRLRSETGVDMHRNRQPTL